MLLFPSLGAFASETLDKIRFDIPEGFTAERGGDHVGFTHTEQQAKTYCQFGVYSSRPANGPLEQEFSSEWQQILLGAPFNNTPSLKNGTTRGGIAYVMGEQGVEKDGFNYYSRLYTFQADKSVFSMLVNAPGKDALAKCERAADSVLGSMKLLNGVTETGTAKASVKTPDAVAMASSAKSGNVPRGNGIAGV